ncbi:uncharacterized protein LOC106779884 [Vigna radiata var. radiata]|uniref:Uncharacterized protein LOC106779884 n=1 Tax=Vigna radiata var. radiata TaxID=3916 RepID=A0A1S3VZ30_VIGRR|nr:uncharacterized protein LOC106779884 [Vigna radiata var. radiata]
MYDDTTDPEAHVKTFTNAIAFQTGSDAIWCRAFSLSLEGEALEWFNSLPPNSIKNFEGLRRMFGRQFSSSNTQDTSIFYLVNLKQGREETLKAFMDRYQELVHRVKGLTTKLALQYILPALKPRPFKDSFCRREPKTMEELRERVTDEVRVEEMKLSYKKQNQEARNKKADDRKFDNQSGRTGGVKQREAPEGQYFSSIRH